MVVAPAWCADYIGLPYDNRGRVREGVDCWGLVIMVLHDQFDIDVPNYDEFYSNRGDAERIGARVTSELEDGWIAVTPGSEAAGDCVLLRSMGHPIHIGVVVVPGLMLHIEQDIDACIGKYTELGWTHRVLGFYRYVG